MRTEDLRAKLQRVIAFPVTPLHTDLSPDIAGLRTNRRALLHHPMAAIVAAGGTGEMYSLPLRESGSCTDCGGGVAGVFR